MTAPRRILLTGASSGLGREMARHLAGPGVAFLLCGRRADALKAVATELRDAGATVETALVDLTDVAAAQDWVDTCAVQPVDLAILNAGMFDGRGRDGALESPMRAAVQVETNLTAPVTLGLRLADHMRDAGQGTILFISSLGAFSAHADAPSYSASKAGLTAFARALREDLAPDGVRVAIAHPGHIETPQTEVHRGPLPGIMPAARAAKVILSGLARGRSEIDFPGHLRWGLRFQSLLPWRMQARINRGLRFWVDDGPGDGKGK
ncbi:SDR family NAD(P)-dependent oxidoreductase [Maritimibacter sp. UBA3975]|uniref:SDR family NAD(P)-dependent oxidoreductase n=1 Tax=Maritimibacter sp. UBA3975 TaxID=1946833 RepID=UPI000C09FE43|nr:SDR family NAD(P)-dependent oxidoreductase [Maritimibacter sp. UBA3975]MAM62864.1 short-chain dehydrogenase [Maritimibacter sp.]